MHKGAIGDAETDLEIDAKLVDSHRAIVSAIPLDKIHQHMYRQIICIL